MTKPNPAYIGVAVRIVQARQAAGLSRDAAAIRLAVRLQTYVYHEQGVQNVKAIDLRRYAEVFGVSYGWLSTGIGVAPKKISSG